MSFPLLECRKRKTRFHGINAKTARTNGHILRLSVYLKFSKDHGRHSILSFLSSLPISVLRSLHTEANKFYDSTHQLYNATILIRCYT